jgi:MurNAc alpha-1-phosphate uridylyltransferase
MKAMILAAGLGKRMQPLTNNCPKPLLKLKNKPLIEYHLEAIAATTIQDVVINTHWLGDMIPAALGDGSRWQLTLHYSHEDALLETAGGIREALTTLDEGNDQPFLVVNGDIYCSLNLSEWVSQALPRIENKQAVLGIVTNPTHNPEGDFVFDGQRLNLKQDSNENRYTYSGIGLYRPSFFNALPFGRCALAPLLFDAIARQSITASIIHAPWTDVGTPERLQLLSTQLSD